jgi:uncharacterized membrane protein YfcA
MTIEISWFLVALFVVATISGATAAIAGFGIGSLLTPLLATRLGMATAVAAVSVPHAVATAVRCWRLRRNIDWRVVRTFGVLSAAGGLAGAFLYTRFSNRALTLTLGALLVATAIAGVSNWLRRLRPNQLGAGALGFASGLFGGLAGNQGGLRAAALFAFPLAPAAFVATSTAAGLFVDAGRMPVYVWRAGDALARLATPIGVATAGVLIGTLLGERVLFGLSTERFRQVVSILIGLLGFWLILRAV